MRDGLEMSEEGAARRLVICAVRYSPNLGDGIISDCIEYAVRETDPGTEVAHIDLAGRRSFGVGGLRNRRLALKLLPRLPLPLRQRLVTRLLGRRLDGLEPDWRALIGAADGVVIGGGQLFSDADLNFPLKVGRIARICRDADVALAVYGVGVSKNWTERGAALFGQICAADLRHVALRDTESAQSLAAQLPQLTEEIRIVPDPAVVAAAAYGPAPEAVRAVGAGRVGICVTADEVLRYHANSRIAGGAPAALFAGVIDRLCRAGVPVALFTNGAVEDEESLARLWATPDFVPYRKDGRLVRHAAFETPRDLAHGISSHDLILAYRLHASIVAFSYGVPSIGLGWDRKVQSFYEAIGCSELCVRAADVTSEALSERIMALPRVPVCEDKRRDFHARALAGVADLLG
ncbi:MAG: polysaccharide pyruvyl transferase family protein [Silicimonas sp.]|nr:polysaccharide pyruvyl transferase family protein [Silicimonas sp.]